MNDNTILKVGGGIIAGGLIVALVFGTTQKKQTQVIKETVQSNMDDYVMAENPDFTQALVTQLSNEEVREKIKEVGFQDIDTDALIRDISEKASTYITDNLYSTEEGQAILVTAVENQVLQELDHIIQDKVAQASAGIVEQIDIEEIATRIARSTKVAVDTYTLTESDISTIAAKVQSQMEKDGYTKNGITQSQLQNYIQQYVNSLDLKSQKGEKGEKGDDGKDGKDGKDYILTNNDKNEIAEAIAEYIIDNDDTIRIQVTGMNGQDGLSAYEIWLDETYGDHDDATKSAHDESEFLSSLAADIDDMYQIWLIANDYSASTEKYNEFIESLGLRGEQGLSAYEVWLDETYGNHNDATKVAHTVSDYQEAFVGASGLSAYEIWLDETYGDHDDATKSAHTIDDYLSSLMCDIDLLYQKWLSSNGFTASPQKYEEFIESLGIRGEKGLSAYEVYLDETYGNHSDTTKTSHPIAEYQATLVGEQGLSAYEVWLDNSFGNHSDTTKSSHTVSDYLAYLKGTSGLTAYEVWLDTNYGGHSSTEKIAHPESEFFSAITGESLRTVVKYGSDASPGASTVYHDNPKDDQDKMYPYLYIGWVLASTSTSEEISIIGTNWTVIAQNTLSTSVTPNGNNPTVTFSVQ